MAVATLGPRAYRLFDRATKGVGLLLLTVALVPGVLPRYSPALALLGLAVGVLSVLVDVADED